MVQSISSNMGIYEQQGVMTQLQSLGIPNDIITQGKSAVEEYAKENNISLPQPPQKKGSESIFTQNKQMQQMQGFQGDNNEAQDITSELSSLGIPDDIIAQGRDALMQYAQQNNLTLPEPPEKPNVDSPQQLNVTA